MIGVANRVVRLQYRVATATPCHPPNLQFKECGHVSQTTSTGRLTVRISMPSQCIMFAFTSELRAVHLWIDHHPGRILKLHVNRASDNKYVFSKSLKTTENILLLTILFILSCLLFYKVLVTLLSSGSLFILIQCQPKMVKAIFQSWTFIFCYNITTRHVS